MNLVVPLGLGLGLFQDLWVWLGILRLRVWVSRLV